MRGLCKFQSMLIAVLTPVRIPKLFRWLGLRFDIPESSDDATLARMLGVVDSLTELETARPEMVIQCPSRLRRIARGSGNEPAFVKSMLGTYLLNADRFDRL